MTASTMTDRTADGCDGNHAGLTEKQLRSHYARGCRDALTRAANTKYRAEYDQRRRDAAAAKTSTGEHPGDAASAPVEPVTGSPAEPDTGGGVGDVTAAHDALEVAQRPASSADTRKPKPVPQAGISSRGAARRLRALTTMGYTPRMLATVTGLSEDSVWWLLTAPPATILTRTHAAVVRAFKQLRVTPLMGVDADRSRGLADTHDWAGPYDWEDIDTDPRPPHPTARKAWNTEALTAAIDAAVLEQGEPEAFGGDAVIEARGDAGRLRVELERTIASYEQLRSTAASAIGERDGLNERIERRDHEITSLSDQLDAANHEAEQLRRRFDAERQRADAALEQAQDLIDQLACADATLNLTEEGRRLASQRDDLIAQGADPTQLAIPIYPEQHTTVGQFAGPALAADVSITIERTDAGGIRIVFPKVLL